MVSECKREVNILLILGIFFFLVKGTPWVISECAESVLIRILFPNAASELAVQKASFERMDHLRQLQNIIQATSREIMWINDCEEEELLYDWSDRNTNIAQKQEAFSVSPSREG